jgi:hypothetical protein
MKLASAFSKRPRICYNGSCLIALVTPKLYFGYWISHSHSDRNVIALKASWRSLREYIIRINVARSDLSRGLISGAVSSGGCSSSVSFGAILSNSRFCRAGGRDEKVKTLHLRGVGIGGKSRRCSRRLRINVLVDLI